MHPESRINDLAKVVDAIELRACWVFWRYMLGDCSEGEGRLVFPMVEEGRDEMLGRMGG